METKYIALIICACIIVLSITAIVIKYIISKKKKNNSVEITKEIKEEQIVEVTKVNSKDE